MANSINVNTDTDESIRWIENGIKNRYINYHDYSEFQNQEFVGKGGFGNVYKTNWKGSDTVVALKSFKGTCIMKEIVNELQLLQEVHFHANIIKFFGITKRKNNEDSIDPDYLFILEYADSGTLRDYLKENFSKLDLSTKLQFAIQISDAVSCLHQKNIIHRDLHSKNILVHQNKVKLADFGLSRRLAEVSNSVKGVIGMLPYIDPLLFKDQKEPKEQTNNEQHYKANKKSDVYSVGVLLWEISSGRLPFESYYSHTLITELQNGKRESPVPGMPDKYVEVYTSCWQCNPEDRPDIHQVFSDLKSLENKNEKLKCNNRDDNLCSWITNITNSLQIKLPESNTMEIDGSSFNFDYHKKLINKLFLLYEKFLQGGIDKDNYIQLIKQYITPNNKNENEIMNYFLDNMDKRQNIILLGDFFRHGIGIEKDENKAFELYKTAAEKGIVESKTQSLVTFVVIVN
ncbi:kinase-like protein [Rhizophagus irregularis]|uniref:Kinase-like protein n=1 Tax=Rhizophagus irregularis TaxID=588596 RepID=A0A2N1NVF8_9GLOM|nr:kinase-like protein [Rhizophagus irregularis]